MKKRPSPKKTARPTPKPPDKPIRIGFCSDLHGDEVCPYTARAAIKSIHDWNPDLRIFGGDLVDLRCLRLGACADDKYAALEADLARGAEFLREYRPTHWLLGNHDDRFLRGVHSPNPIVAYACNAMRDRFFGLCDEIGTKIIPYHIDLTGDELDAPGAFTVGNIAFVHGYESSEAGLKREAAAYWTSLVMQGHTHQFKVIPMDRSTLVTVPGLTKRFHPWNMHRPAFRKHTKGWAFAVTSPKTGGLADFSVVREVAKRHFLVQTPDVDKMIIAK